MKTKNFFLLISGIFTTVAIPVFSVVSCSNEQSVKIKINVSKKADAQALLAQLKTNSKVANNNKFVTWLSDAQNKDQVNTLFNFSPVVEGDNIEGLDVSYSVVIDGENAKFSLEATSEKFELDQVNFLIKLPVDIVTPQTICDEINTEIDLLKNNDPQYTFKLVNSADKNQDFFNDITNLVNNLPPELKTITDKAQKNGISINFSSGFPQFGMFNNTNDPNKKTLKVAFSLAKNESSINKIRSSMDTHALYFIGFKEANYEITKRPIEVNVSKKANADTLLAQLKTESKAANNNDFITWLSDAKNKDRVNTLFNFSPVNNDDTINQINISYSVVIDGANAKFSLKVASGNFKLDKNNFLIKLPNDEQTNNKTKVSVSLVDYAGKKLNELKTESKAANNNDFINWLNDNKNKTKIKDLFIFKSTNASQKIPGFDANFVAKETADKKNIEFTISPIGDFELDKTTISIPLLEIGSYVVGLEFIGNWTSNPSQIDSIYLKLIYDDGLHTLGSKKNWLEATDSKNQGLGIMPVPDFSSIQNKKMTAGIYKTKNSTKMTTIDININQIFESDWDKLIKNKLCAETNPSDPMPVNAKKTKNGDFVSFSITKYRTYFYDIKK